MEILNPYANGLKFLFYSNKNGSTTVSFPKIFFILMYSISIFAGFFQFLNTTSNDYVCVISDIGIEECDIKIGFFGTLFNLSSFVLVTGAFLIIFYSVLVNNEKTVYTYLSIAISGLILLTFFGFSVELIQNVSEFSDTFDGVGYAIIVFWVLFFEPLIFFSSLPIFLEIVSQDYELRGFSPKTRLFLLVEILLILFVISISIFWFLNLNQDPNVFIWFFNTTIDANGVRIVQVGLFLLLLFILGSIFCFSFLGDFFKKNDLFDYLKAVLPWIVFFSLFFFIIRGVPAIFNLDYRLKTLSNILDILVIFFIIFLAIMQVSSVQEHKTPISRNIFLNPLKWTDYIPKYSKILLLLFLNTEIFYQQLHQNALSTITGEANELIILKATSLLFFIVFGFLIMFFKFKPIKPLSEGLGPIKTIKQELIRNINNFRGNK